MRIQVDGELPPGVTSKDSILHTIGVIGTAEALEQSLSSVVPRLGLSVWKPECLSATCRLKLELELA
jgi:homoaconitase/3-isopropylmalate dehydratase large subunit